MVYFILGILFAYIILPVLESMMGVICTILEEYKAAHGVNIAKYNYQVSKIGLDDTRAAHPIGFQIPEEDDENEDELL